jgi:hypothetical protein
MQTEDDTPPPLRRFLDKLDGVRHEGGNVYKAVCPSHDDERQSLQVEWGEKHKVVFTCHAGCERNAIIRKLDVGWKDLEQKREIVATYDYEDEDGELRYQAVRYEPKSFSQRRPDPDRKGKFVYNMRGVDPIPFHLPQIAEAVANGDESDQLWISEGERDCLAINAAWGNEFITTTNHGGAGKWTDEHSAWLVGFKGSVVIVADNDDKPTKPGQRHALAVYESIRHMTDIESVEIVYAPVGKDAAEAVGKFGPEDFIAVTPNELREEIAEGARHEKNPTKSPRTDGWASSGNTEDSSARRELVIVKASEVKSARQRFLWEGRIPLGILALLGGRGGVGKSTFALWAAVELQHGRLPGDFHGKPMPFLYVGIEDDWETQVKPRLQAAGADMDLALFVKVTETVDEATGDRVPDLAEYGPCVMIVDPLPSLIQDDDHRRNVVRAALDPLLLVMAKTQSTVFGIMHTKKGGGSANDLLSGSHAYYDASRAVLLFAKDDESGHVIMSQAKGNYAGDEHTGSLAYRLVSTPVELDDYTVQDYARVEIVGESKLSVEEIVNRDPMREDVGSRARWIVDYLSHRNGRAAQSDIVAAADEENGWSERQMKAARAKCSPRVESKKQTGVMNGAWFWCLAGVEPPSAEESDVSAQESSVIPEEDQPSALRAKSVSSADSSVRKGGIRIKTIP